MRRGRLRWIGGSFFDSVGTPSEGSLLLESGDRILLEAQPFLLLEDGSRLLTEGGDRIEIDSEYGLLLE